MGLISLGLDATRRSEGPAVAEHRALTYDQFAGLGLVSPPSTTGIQVTPLSAFQVSAWWCGINVIAGDIGVLDFDLYRRAEGDDREKVRDHQVAKVLRQPNEYMVPMVFWQTLMAHALGWGNGYAEIERDNAMRPIALWPIMPTDLEPVAVQTIDDRGRKATKLQYRYRGQEWLAAEDVLHIPGLGFDGVRGYPVVSLARQSLGLSIAAERFEGSYFGNGTWMGVVLEHPAQVSTVAQERIRASVEGMHKGSENAFRLFIAEEGMKVARPVTTTPRDAQTVETRDHQIAEIGRWLNLSPHKLKHLMGNRPGGNLEASETDYHVTTLLPWTTRISQICDRRLVSPSEQATHYTEHSYSRRLQPTPKDRVEIQKGYADLGVMTPEQIARQENLPKPEPKAETDLTIKDKIEAVGQLIRAGFDPVESLAAVGLPAIAHTGLIPVTVKEEETPPSPAPPDGASRSLSPSRQRVRSAQRGLLASTIARYIRREAQNAQRAAKRGAQGFGEWVNTFYSAEERSVLTESLEPMVVLCAAQMGATMDPAGLTGAYAVRHHTKSKEEFLAVRANDLEEAVPALTKKWETSRALEGVEWLMAALGAAEEREHVA